MTLLACNSTVWKVIVPLFAFFLVSQDEAIGKIAAQMHAAPDNQPSFSGISSRFSNLLEHDTTIITDTAKKTNHTTRNLVEPVTKGAPPSTIRINAGSSTPYNSPSGIQWKADNEYIKMGTKFRVFPLDVKGTEQDFLYATERSFPGPAGKVSTLNIKVTPGARYVINLLFAEIFFTKSDARIFNVLIQNRTVKKGIDLVRLAGPNTVYTISTQANAPTGIIRIDFVNVVDSAKISAIEVKPFDAPHLAHSVVSGPFTATVVDTSGKAEVRLIGETSHTHGDNMRLVDAQWKEGDTVLGNKLNMKYKFTAGKHTVSLTVKDSGKNIDTETKTFLIKPLGYPAITQLIPDNGSTIGNYDVIIKGSGFTYSSPQTKVFFGPIQLAGASIQIIDASTIKVRCPKSDFGQPVTVHVVTPLGESETSVFNYVGSVPIKFQSSLVIDFAAPTVGRFGPDQKLYIGTRNGQILKVTMNSDFTKSINVLSVQVNEGKEAM